MWSIALESSNHWWELSLSSVDIYPDETKVNEYLRFEWSSIELIGYEDVIISLNFSNSSFIWFISSPDVVPLSPPRWDCFASLDTTFHVVWVDERELPCY